MSDVSIAEQEQAGFAEGYTGTPPAEPVAKVVEEQPKVEAEVPAKEEAKPAPVPEKPVYARVLKQDWDNAKAAIGKVANLESQLAKLTGIEDRLVQQIVEKVRSQTPSGLTVEMSDEDFTELADDFPELARSTRAVLDKIFKKASIKGTGPAEPASAKPAAADPDAVAKEVSRVLLEREANALNEEFPDWSKTIGQPAVDGGPPPEGNEFRAWLDKQDAAYRTKITETQSYADIHDAIRRFNAREKTPAAPDRGAARRAVVEAAVTPRVDNSPPALPKEKTEEEGFEEGFRTG